MRTWMFGRVLLKLPPGGCENRAVGVGAAVTCTDGPDGARVKEKKVTLPIVRRSSEEPQQLRHHLP